MPGKHMDWLRDHMLDYVARSNLDSMDSTENVLPFERTSRPMRSDEGVSALALVDQAAEIMGGIEHQLSETEARAQCLFDSARQKLEVAESRIQAAENERHEAIRQASIRLEEAMKALKEAEQRIIAAESRAQRAEARAAEYEAAFVRIETSIRTQLIERKRAVHKNSIAA